MTTEDIRTDDNVARLGVFVSDLVCGKAIRCGGYGDCYRLLLIHAALNCASR